MPYAITNLIPGGDELEIKNLGEILEIRAPLLAVGTYQGGDRVTPDGETITQPKIRYNADLVKKLTQSALGKVGDIFHSNNKGDVVSFIKQTDNSDPDVGYVSVIVHNQEMIKKINSGEFNGLSMESKVFAEWNEEDKLWDGTDGFISGYGHVPHPAVKTAKIESMKTILLSHDVTRETFNKQDGLHSPIKTKSELTMTDEKISELKAELSARDSQITELTKNDAEKDAKLVELAEGMVKLETTLKEQEQVAQKTELDAILSEITAIDKEFKPAVYFHDSMGFDARKKILNAVLEEKKKTSMNVSLSGLPSGDSGSFDPADMNKDLSGTDFRQLIGGRLY